MGRPPIRAGSSEAPIRATERGRTNGSSDAKLAGDVAASARMALPLPVPRSLREVDEGGKGRRSPRGGPYGCTRGRSALGVGREHQAAAAAAQLVAHRL